MDSTLIPLWLLFAAYVPTAGCGGRAMPPVYEGGENVCPLIGKGLPQQHPAIWKCSCSH